ncbi:hypothetical protein RHMOL_Rhmol12G0042200 [Rhododendron molle]|uniref:Uncharacterized protein n=1 Tax=Rhododendron molle TaxID=49168 RepID=A0ACC0LFR8_RHOML|nr:hypothetical protein RHMOL_Rhmol12G0042200 [Rhododendron molle]
MGMGDCLERFCEEATERSGRENDLEDGELNQRVVRVLLRDGGAVETVDLSRCELRFLPEAFGKIQGLLVLDVSHNQLEVRISRRVDSLLLNFEC